MEEQTQSASPVWRVVSQTPRRVEIALNPDKAAEYNENLRDVRFIGSPSQNGFDVYQFVVTADLGRDVKTYDLIVSRSDLPIGPQIYQDGITLGLREVKRAGAKLALWLTDLLSELEQYGFKPDRGKSHLREEWERFQRAG